MITVFRWNGSSQTGSVVAAGELPATASAIADEDVYWIDLANPTEEEERRVFEEFLPIHPLTLEDITRPRRLPEEGAHLPKVEEFPNYLFAIVNPLSTALVKAFAKPVANHTADEEHVYGLQTKHRPQLSAVLTRHVVITHHVASLECIDEVSAHLAKHGEKVRRGPDYLFHLILDAMVDDYAAVVDRISKALDGLERGVFRDPVPQQLARMLRLKRIVSKLRKTLILEREVLARLMRGEFEHVNEQEVVYYRNVYDHLVRYTELIESAREMASDLMQTHLAAASNRLNNVMKFLTTISTIILPMTLIAGIFGMNFERMPVLKWTWGYPMSLALMACSGVGAYLLFRWRGWL